MSERYPGGIISQTAPVPSGPFQNSTASGVWTLEQAAFWQRQGQWPTAGNLPTDPNFEYVSLLLTGDGTNGAQNNTFLDSSTNNFTITRNGNTTQGSFSPYGPNWSNFFDGVGDYLSIADNAAFALGASNFTVECWAYFNSSVDQYFFGQIQTTSSNRSFVMAVAASKLYFEVRSGTTAYSITAANNIVIGQWMHLAAVRNGNTITFYQNGVSIGTVSVTGVTVNNSTNVMGVGSGGGYVAEPMNGYISNARLVVGTAVYTSAFTPPTAPLTAITNTALLTCQSNRLIDNSSNNFAITRNGDVSVQRFSPFNPTAPYSASVIGGSGYFDGTDDFLSFANNAVFDFGTGNFTVECWVYKVGTGTGSTIYESIIGGNLPSPSHWNLYVNSTDNTVVWFGNDGVLRSTSNAITNNAWSNIVVSRSSSTLKIFINGVEGYSATVTTSYNLSSSGGRIGFDGASGNPTGNKHFFGYISNLRIVKGTAVYTSAFTPPTAPVTAITNTSLLTNFTNAGIPDAAMISNLETVGNAQVSTAVVQYGTGSLFFDGTGDNLASTGIPAVGTANATIEFWLYPTSSSVTYRGIFDSRSTTGTDTGFGIFQYGRVIEVYGNGLKVASAANALNINAWNHVALTRISGTCQIYVNGTASGSSATYSSNLTSTILRIGDSVNIAFPYVGYIDDLRITNGLARYTANFTPPTTAFPTF